MKIEGDLNHFEISLSEAVAGNYIEEKIVIAENIVAGNALLLKKVEWQANVVQDIAPAGAGAEYVKSHLARLSHTDVQEINVDSVICAFRKTTMGDATNNIHTIFELENPSLLGVGPRDGELFPYKYLYVGLKSTNAGALGTIAARVWYYPVTLSKDELLEVTQEAIING